MSRLEELLKLCTVKLISPCGRGTGFFVAREYILTCAHVVQNEKFVQIRLQNQESDVEAIVEQLLPDPWDLALLRVTLPTNVNPSCVYLGEEVQTRDPLYIFGYPDNFPNGCPVTFTCEGLTGDKPAFIKFAQGQVSKGMSGAALLNQRTGKVCGILNFTRDKFSDLGGGALPSYAVLEKLPELRNLQTESHQQDDYWTRLLPIRKQNQLVNVCEQENYVLVVGGSNGENIIQLPLEFKEDRKYTVNPIKLFGGSCINYSIRLMNFGIPVIPIPGVGRDRLGECIQEELLNTIRRTSKLPKIIDDFVGSENFFIPGAITNYSTILVRGEKRTILTENVEQGDFFRHLTNRLDDLGEEVERRIKTVIIGHIYADSEGSGKCTKLLISRFPNADILANFGRSQIEYGFDFWQEFLPKISIFQLNLDEVKRLFQVDKKDLALKEIVTSLNKKGVTSVITMDKLGAVCSYKDGADGLILILPYKPGKIVDPTGAGDAFGAAIASHLFDKHESIFSFFDLQRAVKDSQAWAAYACQKLGGAHECPSKEEIDIFKESLHGPQIQVIGQGSAETILDLLDTAYSPIS
ncbi:MAG: PfkB family carbohydrate kinase [Cyanobacteria bacterium P01_A01_bin.123]